MNGAYYNENDAFAAQWLRNLIAAGHIAPGDVDERSILDVRPDDLTGYVQCHFFAGIAGWSYALRLAGWADDRPVWTGSCPCQPLSSAGQRKGHADERHLWPAFHHLIAEQHPPICFGEQVASKDGREWLAGVRADLETLGYACGGADLCAASIGAPHQRQRLYWVADADGTGKYGRASGWQQSICDGRRTSTESLERAEHSERRAIDRARRDKGIDRLSSGQEGPDWDRGAGENDNGVDLGNTEGPGPQEQRRLYRPGGERHRGLAGFAIETGVPQWNGPTVAVECSDGWRRVSAQPNAFPLAHGVSGRMGKLRGAGNAIVPQVAAEFIGAYLDTAEAA